MTLANKTILKHMQNIFCIHLEKHVAAMYQVITNRLDGPQTATILIKTRALFEQLIEEVTPSKDDRSFTGLLQHLAIAKSIDIVKLG